MTVDACCRDSKNWIHIRSPQCFETAEHFERDVQEDDYHFYFHLTIDYCRECGRVLRPMQVELFDTDHIPDVISTPAERVKMIEDHFDAADSLVQSLIPDHTEVSYELHGLICSLSDDVIFELTEKCGIDA